jgi:hypothetical protein
LLCCYSFLEENYIYAAFFISQSFVSFLAGVFFTDFFDATFLVFFSGSSSLSDLIVSFQDNRTVLSAHFVV